MTIPSLPPEVIHNILLFANFDTSLQMNRVCRSLNELVQKRFELLANEIAKEDRSNLLKSYLLENRPWSQIVCLQFSKLYDMNFKYILMTCSKMSFMFENWKKVLKGKFNPPGSVMMVFLKLETTGLFPKIGTGGQNPRAVKLTGYIAYLGASFETLINPEMPIPPEAVRIHGIGDDTVAKAPTFKRAITQFEDWIEFHSKLTGKKIVCLLGHNIWGYDLRVYRAECERTWHSKVRFESYKSFDTLYLSRSLFVGHKIPNYKLQTLREIFHIANRNFYRDGGEARVNYKVFKHMVKGVSGAKVSEALLAESPVLAMKTHIEHYGSFKPSNVLSRYGKRTHDEI